MYMYRIELPLKDVAVCNQISVIKDQRKYPVDSI